MSTEKTGGSSKGGLDGVVVADTHLSDVDGELGKLTIAGYDAEKLATHAGFEDVIALLEGALTDVPPTFESTWGAR